MPTTLNLQKDTKQIAQLQKQFADVSTSYARVGVLEDHTARLTGDSDNATVGAKQEFGSASENIPVRSFLRVPLMTELPKRWDILGGRIYRSVFLKKEGVTGALRVLGAAGKSIVKEGFRTNGFGTWAPNAPYTIFRKGFNKPLTETGQLNTAITFDVQKASKSS